MLLILQYARHRQTDRAAAVEHGRLVQAYRRLGRPDGIAWARYLKQSGLIYEMGEHCSVSPHAIITDPAYLRLGNNVRIADCTILGHDGSVHMINRAFGLKFDSVGPCLLYTSDAADD